MAFLGESENKKNYYETQSVQKGKSSYSCECCGKNIPKGTPSDVHKYYPEFMGYRTHPKCSSKFLAGDWCEECGGWFPVSKLDSDGICKSCLSVHQTA